MEAKSYERLAGFIDLLLDAVCVVDAKGRFVFASAACERIFGYTQEELVGRAMIEMVLPEDRERTLHAASEIMSGQQKFNFENRYVRKDGRVVHIMWSARWSESDQVRIAVARDITERKQAELMQAAFYSISEAAHTAEDLSALFQQIHQIIARLLPAPNFSVALHNEENGELSFPYHADERDGESEPGKSATAAFCATVIRKGQPLLLVAESLPAPQGTLQTAGDRDALCWLGVPLSSKTTTIGALILRSYAGGTRYSERDKELLQFVSTQVATAIERKRLNAQLQHMAQYDALTGLPNRALLHDRLESALVRTRRQQGRMSLLYLDLDNFKRINDSLGHAAGDLLLQEVANRLKLCVRNQDTVARMSGDEFVVLLENIQLPEHSSMVAETIRRAISRPINIHGRSLNLMASIGIALYPEHGDEARQLLHHADEVMFVEKKNKLKPLSNE